MVLLDQPLSPWFARLKVPELPLGQETSLVTSTGGCVPNDISLHLCVGLEPRWDTISQFGSIYSLGSLTAILCSPEHLVPQPLSGMPHVEGGGAEWSTGPVAPGSVKCATPQPAPRESPFPAPSTARASGWEPSLCPGPGPESPSHQTNVSLPNPSAWYSDILFK